MRVHEMQMHKEYHFEECVIMSRLINDDDWILLKEATEELYKANAMLSAMYCTRRIVPDFDGMDCLNAELGRIIKKLRSVQE